MGILDANQRARLRAAVERAEADTSGEFVTVLASAADSYPYIPTLWAALIALLLPVPAVYAGLDWEQAYMLQVAVFFVLASLFRWEPIKMCLIPAAVKRRRAYRLAREQFTNLGLHLTPRRAGVLLFVSAAERYVEILADQGIAEKVDNTRWQGVIDEFVAAVRAGNIAVGMERGVERCAALMTEAFPPESNQVDLLPNHLVEIGPD
ncbi:MAG: TPM domain-containing protein [Chromatiales bacterium]|nr:TPM domain-containing protein [Chromatiales bacterium]